MESQLSSLISKLETLVNRFETAQGGVPVATTTAVQAKPIASVNHLLKDFDTEVISKIKAFEDAATTLGGDIIPTIVRLIKC